MAGTLDNAPGPRRMEAIDRALTVYYGTPDWRRVRDRRGCGCPQCRSAATEEAAPREGVPPPGTVAA